MHAGGNHHNKWAHLFLGKSLNPAHAMISVSRQIWLWWNPWNGLQIPNNKEWQPQKSSSWKSTYAVNTKESWTKETTDNLSRMGFPSLKHSGVFTHA